MGEYLAVFLVLLYDIVITLFVGLIIYCAVAKRAFTFWGWIYRDRNPGQYRKRMLGFSVLAIVLIAVRLLPFDLAGRPDENVTTGMYQVSGNLDEQLTVIVKRDP